MDIHLNLDSEWLVIRDDTGGDRAVKIAGPGSRSFAFVVDWHIRVLIALAWLVAAVLVFNGGLTLRAGSNAFGAAYLFFGLAPPVLIYFLYHPVLEILMGGQTPGKRTAGVRIIDREGGIPNLRAILIRNAFRIVDSLPVFYFVGLVTCSLSTQRLRIGDMAAGTLLILDEPGSTRSAASSTPAHSKDFDHAAELIEQILERWPALAVDKRDSIARSLLTRIDAEGTFKPIEMMSDEELRAHLMVLASRARSRQ